MAKTVGPLNPAHIESVTHEDHDHKILWTTTNDTLKSLQDQVTALQASLAALTKKS